jgi:hypothetical protein
MDGAVEGADAALTVVGLGRTWTTDLKYWLQEADPDFRAKEQAASEAQMRLLDHQEPTGAIRGGNWLRGAANAEAPPSARKKTTLAAAQGRALSGSMHRPADLQRSTERPRAS